VESKTKIQLDEILKLLMKSSDKMMVPLLNKLFNEDYEIGNTNIEVSNNEFIKKRIENGFPTPIFDVLKADLFLIVTSKGNTKVYHLEFQLRKDEEMAIRIFEYGFWKAEEMRPASQMVYRFPKPLVIYFEKNSTIGDELELLLIFPDETEYTYKVPILKYWEKSKSELVDEKLYALLPLQLFSLRAKMEKAEKSGNAKVLKELGQAALVLAHELLQDALKFKDLGDVTDSDFDKLVTATENLIYYLNEKYLTDETIEVEAKQMTLSVMDRVKQETLAERDTEIIRNAIFKGYDNETIHDLTGLSLEKIEAIRSKTSTND